MYKLLESLKIMPLPSVSGKHERIQPQKDTLGYRDSNMCKMHVFKNVWVTQCVSAKHF